LGGQSKGGSGEQEEKKMKGTFGGRSRGGFEVREVTKLRKGGVSVPDER